MRGCGAVAALAAAGMAGPAAAEAGDVDDLLDGLPTNWGRWGEDDELGALNLLGSEQARAGMEAAMCGEGVETFSLQQSMTGEVIFLEEKEVPTIATGDPAFPGRTPARRGNVQDEQSYREGEIEPLGGGMKFSDDKFFTDFFLQGTTHLDALGHAWYGEQIYNGFDAVTTAETRTFDRVLEGCPEGEIEEITETRGHGRAGIENAADEGIAGRAVLLDIGREMGGENGRLNLGTEITLADLEATASAQRTTIRERDIILLRTGAIARTRDPDAEWDPLDEPGLRFSEELVCWLHDMDIPILGADNLAVERVVQEIDGQLFEIPLHGATLRNLGVYLCEILWLEDLAASCAADSVHELLFTGAPLYAERSTGGPFNPIAMKATGAE
jgi:hypothetical protein